MALQSAQLGSLPSLNLGGGHAVEKREPMWHKVLGAFLAGIASNTASGLTNNAFGSENQQTASAMGLKGAPATQQPDQPWYMKVLKGPEWDDKLLKAGIDQQEGENRNTRLAASEKERADLMRSGQAETAAYHGNMTAQHAKELEALQANRAETAALRKQQADNTGYDRGQKAIDRWEQMTEKRREFEAGGPQRTSNLAKTLSETQDLQRRQDPTWAAQVDLAKMQAMVGPEVWAMMQQSAKDAALMNVQKRGGNQPQSTPTPMPPTQPSGAKSATDRVRAVERANTAPTASQPGQSGASQAPMTPVDIIPPQANNDTNPNPMMQHVGDTAGPSDLMGLVNPQAVTANDTTPNAPSTGAFIPPFNFDPETMRRAALLAKLLGQPQGNGGTPGAAGSGGIPTGYG